MFIRARQRRFIARSRDRRTGLLFVGRPATWRYDIVDQAVGQALANYRRHIAEERETPPLQVAVLAA